jgi:RNA polymerase sigma-70 factor (ECF subfamily)
MANRSNEEWLVDLKSGGEAEEAALADLRAVVIAGLPYALSTWLSPTDPQFDALVEEVAQETLIRALDHLDSFEGRSQFTTWVQKIAVRQALTELRRRRWRDFSLDELVEEKEEGTSIPSLLWDPAPGPGELAEQSDILQRVRKVITDELTEKQRQAMIAVTVRGAPLEEVARRMGMNRNALYKLLHDARLNLKRRLASEGLEVEDIFSTFANQ